MGKKLTGWKVKGMNQDLSVSAFNPEFAFENRNLRLSTNENNTLMSWVNEKGTQQLEISIEENGSYVYAINGWPIGTAILNDYLILFTTDNNGSEPENYSEDSIYKLWLVNDGTVGGTLNKIVGKLLYRGHLGFSTYHPLETLVSYEAEHIQKVYWTDGVNQPRMINIQNPMNVDYDDTSFDFVNTLKLEETVKVRKILGGNGRFAPGVIQYAFTYYYKYGQESNIFYTTPLYYLSHNDRGASPEEMVDNAFEIEIHHPDLRFDYLRVYSIQRTDINSTPIVKRIQDIALEGGFNTDEDGNVYVSYTDTGFSGNSVDPMELQYKGGELVYAGTMEQKDGTLFLGNLRQDKSSHKLDFNISMSLQDGMGISSSYRDFYMAPSHSASYLYSSQLTAYKDAALTESVPCGGFKWQDYYRLGVQFQSKTGKWTEPVFIGDMQQTNHPSIDTSDSFYKVSVPTFTGYLPFSLVTRLSNEYVKVRPVVVFPELQDRSTICQGVASPTVYTKNHRGSEGAAGAGGTSTVIVNDYGHFGGSRSGNNNTDNTNSTQDFADLWAQSSWFFRACTKGMSTLINGNTVCPAQSSEVLPYRGTLLGGTFGNNTDPLSTTWNPSSIRSVEIDGLFEDKNKFYIDNQFLTFHSPDIEFDEALWPLDFHHFRYREVGSVKINHTLSDIDIMLETPAASSIGAGFVHASYQDEGSHGIVSGLFFDDVLIDEIKKEDADSPNKYRPFRQQQSAFKWMVYLWNKEGSLNNDVVRAAGTRTAVLQQKIISNLRYSTSDYYPNSSTFDTNSEFDCQLFSSNENTIVKVDNKIYRGNIDTSLASDYADGFYLAFDGESIKKQGIRTDVTSTNYWRLVSKSPTEAKGKLQKWGGTWNDAGGSDDLIGDDVLDLAMKKAVIRMKYKSTPHVAMSFDKASSFWDNTGNQGKLPIYELGRDVDTSLLFGGKSEDALRENTWVPCGEPVRLYEQVHWEYGDTYYQRWDCLKTYCFTPEDINQVVEIGSFMLETRVNIDGRYDKNRGQSSNLYMSPRNFNLLNRVYSQVDNFFSYKILPQEEYMDTVWPNRITWSLTKESGADTDLWTSISLGSVLELDGDKGEITSLQRFNDQLICFQDTGISQILYNENVQVASTQGVPIEIANSGKVQGKRYLSNTIGCSNKWSIAQTPSGLYFMDDKDKSIQLFNGQLHNVSVQGGFNTWVKQHNSHFVWNPSTMPNFVTYYDQQNQDVMFIRWEEVLSYSEKLGAFTSFYDYQGAAYFCNLNGAGLWLREENEDTVIYKHQAGDYCKLFGRNVDYSMQLVGNPEPQLDKTFTNMEFRACVDGEGRQVTVEQSPTGQTRYKPYLPFDYLEAWNEYQYGVANLDYKFGHPSVLHHQTDDSASLKRKFRMWRCDIPRSASTVSVRDVFDHTFDYTFHNAKSRGVPNRMRNPWLYLLLRKEAAGAGETLPRVEIHDLVMTYYD